MKKNTLYAWSLTAICAALLFGVTACADSVSRNDGSASFAFDASLFSRAARTVADFSADYDTYSPSTSEPTSVTVKETIRVFVPYTYGSTTKVATEDFTVEQIFSWEAFTKKDYDDEDEDDDFPLADKSLVISDLPLGETVTFEMKVYATDTYTYHYADGSSSATTYQSDNLFAEESEEKFEPVAKSTAPVSAVIEQHTPVTIALKESETGSLGIILTGLSDEDSNNVWNIPPYTVTATDSTETVFTGSLFPMNADDNYNLYASFYDLAEDETVTVSVKLYADSTKTMQTYEGTDSYTIKNTDDNDDKDSYQGHDTFANTGTLALTNVDKRQDIPFTLTIDVSKIDTTSEPATITVYAIPEEKVSYETLSTLLTANTYTPLYQFSSLATYTASDFSSTANTITISDTYKLLAGSKYYMVAQLSYTNERTYETQFGIAYPSLYLPTEASRNGSKAGLTVSKLQ